MASNFDTDMAARNSALFSRMGESISYTMTGQSAADVDAIVEREAVETEELEDQHAVVRRLRLHVQTADITTRTLERDKATVDGLVWVLEAEEPPVAGVAVLRMRRTETVEKRGRGHRMGS
jgi:hypothetical protein